MKANRTTLTALLLTLFGVIPPTADASTTIQRAPRSEIRFPEDARVIDAVKRVHDDIRAGRLGH